MNRSLAVLLLLLSALVPAHAGKGEPPPHNTVLISCDGLDRRVLRELLDAGKLPHFAALIAQGSLQEIDITGHATRTVPSHVVMLTGLPTNVTEFRTNEDLKPLKAGWTILERLEQWFGGDNIRTLMVTGKSRNVGGATPKDVYGLARAGMDYFHSEDRGADKVTEDAIEALGKGQGRYFLFLHFPDPDRAGHLYGVDSKEYRQGIEACDRALGQIMKRVQGPNTFIYVTADHGFDDHAMNHMNAPKIFLATNDPQIKKGGSLFDVPVTLYDRLGVDWKSFDPRPIGHPLY